MIDQFLSTLAFAFLIGAVVVIVFLRVGISYGAALRIIRTSQNATWSLIEFTQLCPSKLRKKEYYRFTEETVRSSAYRYNGRFDSAVLHWEEVPILDVIIEYKFPVTHLPVNMKDEDKFQAGLYALALAESGISCSSAKLVTVYCLQDVAKTCTRRNSKSECWNCRDGRIFEKRFNAEAVQKQLKKLDEVWYGKRAPKASPTEAKCRLCPFSKKGVCNYSAI
jgi:hypothetical protein